MPIVRRREVPFDDLQVDKMQRDVLLILHESEPNMRSRSIMHMWPDGIKLRAFRSRVRDLHRQGLVEMSGDVVTLTGRGRVFIQPRRT